MSEVTNDGSPPAPRMITVTLDQQSFQVCASTPEEALESVAGRLRVEEDEPEDHADGYDPTLHVPPGPGAAVEVAMAGLSASTPAPGTPHSDCTPKAVLADVNAFTLNINGASRDVIASSEEEAWGKVERTLRATGVPVSTGGDGAEAARARAAESAPVNPAIYQAALVIFEAEMTAANEELERDQAPIMARWEAQSVARSHRKAELEAPFVRARTLAYAEADRVRAKAQELRAAEADRVGRWFAATKDNLSKCNVRAMSLEIDLPQQTPEQRAHALKVAHMVGMIGSALHSIKARPGAMDRSAQALFAEASRLQGEASVAFGTATAGLSGEHDAAWNAAWKQRQAAMAPLEARFDTKAIAAMEAYLTATGQAK